MAAERGRRPGISTPARWQLAAGRWPAWLLAAALAGCGEGSRTLTFTGPVMGTGYRVVAVGVRPAIDEKALESDVVSAMEQVNRQMSTYLPGSELSRFNRHAGTDWFPVSPDLVTVIDAARRVSQWSGGAFDVTVGPLVNLWGFGPGHGEDRVPDAAAIEREKRRVDYRQLVTRTDPPAIRKLRPDIYVDLSAIAKGYAVDRVCAALQRRGVRAYLVDIGGDLRASGHNERGDPWSIAIEKPVPGERVIQDLVQLTGQALATSGDYRNYFERDGRRYSHTIDPRNGHPIEHRLAAVSVAAASAMEADALATALMVLGPQQAFQLAERLQRGAYLVIKRQDGFSVQYTREFEKLLRPR